MKSNTANRPLSSNNIHCLENLPFVAPGKANKNQDTDCAAGNNGTGRGRAGFLRRLMPLLVLIVICSDLNAAQRTASVSGSWSATATWGGASVPVAGDNIIVNTGITLTIDVANTPVITTVVINTQSASGMNGITVGANTLNCSSISLAGSGTAGRFSTVSISTGTINCTSNISFSGTAAQARLIFSGAGTLNIGGTLGAGGTFTASTGTVNYNGAAQTAGVYTYNNLTVSGSGAKTFATTPTVSGILSMEGTATITVTTGVVTYGSSATLQYNTSTARTASSEEWITNFAGSGGVKITNTGAITLNENKTFTSCPLTVDAGATLALLTFNLSSPTTLTMSGGATAGSSITGTTGTLTLGGNVTINDATTGTVGASISCPVALGATRTFTVADDGTSATDLTISSVISGATFGVTKAGTGTMALIGGNTYTGAVTINAGILAVNIVADASTNSSLGTGAGTPAISIAAAGTLQYTGSGHSSNRAITLTGSGGTIDASGSGTLTLSGGVTGNTNNLVLTGTGAGVQNGVIGTTSGTVTKNGAGTWTLSGANTFSGAMTISAGTLIANTVANASSSSSLGTGATTAAISIGATGTLRYTGSGHSSSRAITLTGSGGTIDASGSGTLTLSGGVTGNTNNLVLTGTGAGVQSGVIGTSSGTVIKNGAGTWTLSNSNTYTGATTVSAGTLKLGANGGGTNTPLGTTGSGTTVSSGGTLDLNGFTLGTAEGLNLNGTGVSNNGALTNTGGNASYSGAIVLQSASEISTTSSGTLTLSGNMSGNFAVTFDGDGTGTYSGIRSSTTANGTLIKEGAGTWTLSNSNTYTGTTTFNDGIVSISAVANLGSTSSGALIFSNGATLKITAGITITEGITLNSGGATFDLEGPLTLTGAITGGGGIATGGNDLILQRASGNNAIGAITINSGRVFVFAGLNNINGSSISVASGATLDFGFGNTSPTNTMTFASGACLANRSGTLTVSTANVNFPTAGTMIFNQDDQVTTPIMVNGNYPTLTGDLTIQTGGINTTVGTVTLSGIINGGFGLNKTLPGTLTLSGANTYTGATNVNGGTLKAGVATNAFGNGSNVTLADASGVILDITGFNNTIGSLAGGGATGGNVTLGAAILTTGNSTNTSYGGVISGTGSIIKAGTGEWTVSGSNSYSGTTTVSAGTLIAGANAPSGSAGAFGNASSAITLGDVATTTNNSSPSLLTGGVFTIGRAVTIANQATSGTYSIGGNTANTSVFSGTVTMNKPLSVTQVASGTVQLGGTVTANTNKLTKIGAGTLQRTTGGLSLDGDFEITTGTYDANGQTTTVAASHPMTVSGGIYTAGSATQTFNGGLVISGGTFTGAGGTVTTTNMTLSSGTLTAPSGTFNVTGNWSKSGGTFTPGSNTVTFNGGSAQNISGSQATAFNSLTLNNTSGLTLSGSVDATVTGTLTITNGKITTGSNKLIVGSAGSSGTINNAGAGKYVYGNLRRFVANTSAPTVDYPIGDASNYTPVSITFAGTTSGSGYLEASTTATAPGGGAMPSGAGLDASKYINRRWVVTNTGVAGFTNYSPTFTFVAGDIQGSANTANLVVRKLDGGTWSATTNGTRTGTTTQCTGLTSFSEFACGEDACTAPSFTACPSNIDSNTDAGLCTAVVNYTATASGTPAATYSYEFTGATTGSGSGTGTGAVFNKGVTTVTITALNDCGDDACSFTVTVTDDEKPGITCPSNPGAVACPANVPAAFTLLADFLTAGGTASDNCTAQGSLIFSHSDGTPTGSYPCSYSFVRTYSVEDASGNVNSCEQVISVNYSGSLTAPANGSSTVSCASAATNPGAPADITDACGGTVSATLVGSSSAPSCNGDVVWTYRYTACDGTTTADWTYTYHVIYSGGLTAPANGSSTVSCAAAATNPGAPADITDACGGTVSATLVGSSSAPSCNGDVVWTYRYTACDGTTTADWTYTYHVIYSGGLTAPANGSSTVSCASAATNPGAPADITDACGRTVTASLVGSSSAPSCNGDVVWTYRYTACDGTTTADWTYTYHVIYSGGLTAPANGSSTVSCAASATNPGAPADITDACGRTVTASLVGSSSAPSCNGDVVWTYRYTACDGTTTADWTYTYHVIYSGGLTAPANGSSTVSCASAATNPGAPADITDACGGTVSATLVGSSSAPSCNGDVVWTYRYTACDGTTTADWTYTYHVIYSGGLTAPANGSSTVSCASAATNPGAPADITDACGRTVSATLVGSSSAPSCNGDVVWTYRYTACDGTTTADWTYTYHVIYSGGLTAPANGSSTVSCAAAATNPGAPADITDACGGTVSATLVGSSSAPSCNGDVVWTYRYTACDGTTTADWTYTYHVIYSGGLTAPANGSSTVSCAAAATNPGAPADITDACGGTVSATLVGSSSAPSCNGDVVWTYRYTACDGTTTADWTYTYHVIYSGGLTAPANGSSTVSCASAATNPGAPADITDACGRTVTASLVGSSSAPSCNGDVVWTYRYTACDGTTTADWTYTYHVIYSGGLTAPANGSSTVSCASAATNPGAPADITDACGRTVSATLVGSSSAPSCNGDVVWTYRYTACDGTTTADWTYTYHIIYSGGLTAPANGSSTVSCAAAATDPGAPADITDACGGTVSATLVGSSSAPSCNGDVVWTYRYTACDGTTTADWTYTYHVIYSGGLTAPANGSSTVSCAAAATDPGAPADITDGCGRTVSATLVGSSSAPSCNGDVVWTYRYTACDGTTTADWTYTYHVIYSGGLTAPANGSSTVSCAASATNPGAPADITDACGRTVSATLVGSSSAPSCNGDVVWTYRYTACDGTTTADWTYTYHVIYSGGLTAPANGSSTVSCASAATNPGAPADITDACGGTVSATLVGSSSAPSCNGDVVWTYRYTACDGTTTADWTYTYHVIYSGGLTAPANGSSTVSCAASATNPGAPADITDACGRTVSATLVGSSSAPSCNGDVVWTYRYTACDGTTTADWTYTYHVIYSGGLTAPANGSSTVSCAAAATNPGAPADITDACGGTVSATLVGSSSAPSCNGDVVWTYRYTACDGTTTADWTYTYHVIYSGGLTAPANGSSTVSCAAAATNPGAPADITDACGGTVSATLVGSSSAPSCNGDVVWTYRYTACDGTTTADWTYTYHVIYSGGLTAPANGSSTVSCAASATDPGAPADITDGCGRTVSATLVGSSSAPSCNGDVVWTYRYTACDGTTTADWTYTYHVIYSGGLTAPANGSSTVSCAAAATNPGAPADITDACGRTVSATLVGSSSAPSCNGDVVWTYRYTACDGTTTADWTYTYHVIYSGGLTAPANGSSTVSCAAAATNPGAPADITDACGGTVSATLVGSSSAPSCNGDVVWTYRYTACDGTTTADWTYTYHIIYSGGLTAPANGSSTVSCAASATNPGAPADITDACGRTVTASLVGSSSAPSCNGDVVWTYRYTACDGTTTADWTYTYHVIYSGGLTAPANGSSTVSCAVAATNPGAPADITDACGRTVTASLVGSSSAPSCNGDVVWTYRYTACDGTTTADWTYTYHVIYSGGLTAPANGSSTVSCAASATNPGAPADITDACGRTVTASLVGSSSAPSCNGDVVWTYRYTACDGTTTADWTYTYHVIYSGGLTAPANGSSTVSCAAAATDPGAPADITDACGRTVTATLVGSSSAPSCNGDVVWTYRYTACDGTTTADWTYTYHVIYSGGLTAPANGSSTVSCAASATDPGAPADITDGCGRTVSATLVGSSSAPSCNGDVVWTYRYTACDGTTTADWTYTYHVIYSGGLTAPANGSSTVSCAAAATNPGAPADITDACGGTVSATLVGSSSAPSCNGDVVWTYRYTACDGTTTADWTYTYHIIYSGGLTAPANGSSTVSCAASATNPGAPADITDACGRTVTATLVGSSSAPSCNGDVVWTYRYTACDGTTTADWTYTYHVIYSGGLTAPANGSSTVSCATAATNPGAPADITDACGGTVSATLVGSSSAPSCNGDVVWTYRYTACDGTTTADWTYTYHVIYSGGLTAPANGSSTVSCAASATNPGAPADITDGCGRTVSATLVGSSSAPSCNGDVVWTYRYTACDGTTTADWTYTYHVIYSGGLTAPANGSSTVSCATAATNPGAPADITDACGGTVSATLVGSSSAPSCNGDVVWTYRYTACDGTTTADWTYTYHVIYSGGLTAPANGSSTVSCAASATNPGAPADITDGCGRTVSATLVGSSSAPSCNGDVVWTYRYTACDGTTTADWTYTYHIIYSGGLTAPANGSSTVSCAASATDPGAPADITDGCGRTVSATLVGSSSAPSCNGDVVWTYRYTACDGTTTADWTYTYHVIYSGGLTAPANGSSTVSCAAAATNPGAPADITDGCGRTVSATLVGSSSAPSCNGDVVWTYRYTACDGTTTADWTYTYHIIYSGGLTAPAPGSSTVSCSDGATDPGAPADITDGCGRTVSAILVGSSTPVPCNGDLVWTYRYTGCDGTTTADWTYTYHIIYSGGLTAPAPGSSTVFCPSESEVAPGAPDILDACGRTVSGVYVSNDATPSCNGDVVWHYIYTACDGTTTADWTYTYHVIYSGGLTAPANGSSTVSCAAAATNPGAPADITDACGGTVSATLVGSSSAPSCNGDVVWTYRYTACDGTTTADWTYTYHVIYSGGLTAPANGSSTVSCAAAATNPGAPADITDACGRTVSATLVGSSSAPSCNGDVVWTYRYTACDGTTTADWTYTYHVIYSGGLTAPANGSSTVSCAAAATNPGAPADITDACGRTVTATLVGSSSAPSCNGDVVWTYRYTACDGTTTADWTYTYHIIYSGGLTAPAPGSSTVSCSDGATDPGAPADITDGCGRIVSAILVGSSTPVPCNGDLVWTYRYTGCDGTTTADWTYTYHIIYSGGLTAPAPGSSTVSCPSESEVAPGAPDILDACGRTVSGIYVSNDAAPSCNGDVEWHYIYTACDGTTTADWTYTYHVIYSGGLTAPANGSSTVSCAAAATNPGAPADITDACGRTVSATLVGSSSAPSCNGDVVWTYRYTACDGTTTADWTYTYHVIYSGGLTAPANGSSTVSCAAAATNPGAPADITDGCGRTVSATLVGSSSAPSCNGDVVWTYRYTACDGTTTADWTYTYHIIYSGGLTAPAPGSSTVSCSDGATDPGAPADITDGCGRIVSAILVGSSTPVPCNGDLVWTYRYTGCDGTTTADWTYTYHIIYSGGLTAPAPGSSTVSCPSESEVAPGAPDILDACGRTVSGIYVSNDAAPSCNGDVEWHYIYTACDGTTTADWTYTYHVIYSGGLTAPSNGSSTISCPDGATDPGAPADITDGCGRTVSAVLVGSSTPVTCNGDLVWTYRYTGCDGTTTADWIYTYHVIHTNPVVPSFDSSAIQCVADIVIPAPPVVYDVCGALLPPVLNVYDTGTSCNGTRTYTYSYTDCSGLTSDWNYVYIINDNTPPDLTCASDQAVFNDPGSCFYTHTGTGWNASATDNCSGATDVAYTLSGATISTPNQYTTLDNIVFNEGVTTIAAESTDDCGNTSTCSYTITVTDNEVPSIIVAADATANTSDGGTGDCTAEVAIANAVFGDNCSGSTLSWVMTGATVGNGSGQVGTHSFNKGVTTITYTVTDGNSNTATDAMTVTVSDDENPTVAADGNTTAHTSDGGTGDCTAEVAITDAVFGDNCTGSTLTWAMTGATVDNGSGQVSTHTFNIGVTTITYTVTDGNSHTATDAMTVTVSDDEAPSITCPTTVLVNTDNNSCVATGVVLGTPVTNDNCGVLSIVNNHPSTTYPIGNTNVMWTVEDIHGNTSTCIQVVTVTNANVVAVNISTSTTTICSGTVIPFTATPVNGGTNPSYQWKVNNVNQGTNSPNFTPATLANGNVVTCVMTSNIACPIGLLTKTSNPVQMSLIGAPAKPGTITQTSGKLKLCPGDTASYSIAPVLNAINLTWTAPSGSTIISGQNTTSVTLAFNSGFAANGNLNVVAENNCGFSQIQSKTITRNTLPVVNAISGTSPVACVATGVSYSVNAVEDASFNWYFNNSNTVVASGNGTNSILADFSGFTTTTLYVSATTGCGTSALKSKVIQYIQENAGAISGPTSVCSLATNIAYSITPLPNVTSYTWTAPNGATISDGVTSQSGSLITGSASVTINFGTKSGTVKVKSNNCSSGTQSSLNVSVTSCIRSFAEANEQNNSSISLFPNPARELINVIFQAAKETRYEIRVYDALGKEVLQQVGQAVEGSNQTALDISGLAAGVYLVRVHGENMNYQARFTVE